jgi:transcription antitermination factor NusG
MSSTAPDLYSVSPDLRELSPNMSDNFSGWFVVQVACRHEDRVATMLEYKGYENFVPSRKLAGKLKGGHARKERLLFPGYLFCRLRRNSSGLIVTTPGVIRILSFAGAPSVVPVQQMRNIRLIVDSGLPAETHEELEVGSLVRITEGPLTGLEGTLMQRKNRRRIAVLVKLLRQSVSVEMADWQVCAVKPVDDPCPDAIRPRLTLLPGGSQRLRGINVNTVHSLTSRK